MTCHQTFFTLSLLIIWWPVFPFSKQEWDQINSRAFSVHTLSRKWSLLPAWPFLIAWVGRKKNWLCGESGVLPSGCRWSQTRAISRQALCFDVCLVSLALSCLWELWHADVRVNSEPEWGAGTIPARWLLSLLGIMLLHDPSRALVCGPFLFYFLCS